MWDYVTLTKKNISHAFGVIVINTQIKLLFLESLRDGSIRQVAVCYCSYLRNWNFKAGPGGGCVQLGASWGASLSSTLEKHSLSSKWI